MSFYGLGDTLVLKVEQSSKQDKRIINRLYVFYDEGYVIRGCRYYKNGHTQFYNHSFNSDTTGTKSILNFILFLMPDKIGSEIVSVCLLNYPDLPEYSNNITYDVLDYEGASAKYGEVEISGFDYSSNSGELKLDIKRCLKILKNVFPGFVDEEEYNNETY